MTISSKSKSSTSTNTSSANATSTKGKSDNSVATKKVMPKAVSVAAKKGTATKPSVKAAAKPATSVVKPKANGVAKKSVKPNEQTSQKAATKTNTASEQSGVVALAVTQPKTTAQPAKSAKPVTTKKPVTKTTKPSGKSNHSFDALVKAEKDSKAQKPTKTAANSKTTAKTKSKPVKQAKKPEAKSVAKPVTAQKPEVKTTPATKPATDAVQKVTGSRIFMLRNASNMSQNDLADRLLCNRSSVAQWENGRTNPSDVSLSFLTSVFGVSRDYLLGRETTTFASIQFIMAFRKCKEHIREAIVQLIDRMKYMTNETLNESHARSFEHMTDEEAKILNSFQNCVEMDQHVIINLVKAINRS